MTKKILYKLPQKTQIILPLLVSGLFLIPFLMTKGAMYGDDLPFHLERMLTYESIFRSPVNFHYFYGVGQGINYFYPFLTYYPYYILYRLIDSFYIGWLLYLYLLNLVTYFIGYKCVKDLTNSSKSGHIFSILYIFSGYRLTNIVTRFAVGEIIAMAFIPLAFYGFYHILKGDYKKWYWLSIGMTLIVYSHMLSVVITSIIFAIIFLLVFWTSKEKLIRFANFMVATLATIAMGAFQLFPMLEQVISNKLVFPGMKSLDDTTIEVKNIIVGSWDNDLSKYLFGTIVFLLIILLIVLLIFKKIKFNKEDAFIFLIVLVFIFSESKLMHWNYIENGLVNSIQFVWRLNTYITLFIIYLGSKYLVKVNLNRRAYIIMLMGIFIINGVSQYNFYRKKLVIEGPQPLVELSSRITLNDMLNSKHNTVDYTNASANEKTAEIDRENKILHKVFREDTEEEVISNIDYHASYVTIALSNDTSISHSYELPFYKYKGQIVKIDNQEATSLVSSHGSTTVAVPSGFHVITVAYQYTILAKVSALLSILSVLLVIAYITYVSLHKFVSTQ